MGASRSVFTTLLTVFALSACGGNGSTGPGGGNGGGGGDETIVIQMQNTAFVAPGGGDAVTVPVGTTIEWVNLDNGLQHTATSSAEPAGGAEINTGLMSFQQRRSFTPQVEGTWTYFCEVHPGIMVGATITATASGSTTGVPTGGDTSPGGPYDP